MLQLIEIGIIIGLIVWQGWVYFKNRALIQQVTAMYPAKELLGVGRVEVVNPEVENLNELERLQQGQASFKWTAYPGAEFYVPAEAKAGNLTYCKWNEAANKWESQGSISANDFAHYYAKGDIKFAYHMVDTFEYDAVQLIGDVSPQFVQITQDTNDYLQANKGAAAAFDTLRDISEREADLLDGKIQAQISTPLYLGLLGTFAGAIIGLFSLLYSPDRINPVWAENIRYVINADTAAVNKPVALNLLADSAKFYAEFAGSKAVRQETHQMLAKDNTYSDIPKKFSDFEQQITEKTKGFNDEAINSFLLGILIAMGGSIFGLAFTLAGNQQLKTARATRDRLKNVYYNFLQKSLLPKLNSDMQQSMSSLKAVLDTFNEDFFSKIQTGFFSKIAEFTPLIGAITSNITIQKDFLEKLQNIGYTQLANATIKVFDRVDESAATFEKFLGYQYALNTAVSKGAETVTTITALLNRLGSLEKALNEVPSYLEQHDERIRAQVQFFGQHNQLLANVGAKMNQTLSEDAAQMHLVLDGRRQTLEAEAQAAHKHWEAYFRQLNNDNIFQKITEYLNPFKELPAQQQALNKLQEEQARRSAAALTALQQRIERDEQVQRESQRIQSDLLVQIKLTNAVLVKMNERSLFDGIKKMFAGNKTAKSNGQSPPTRNRQPQSEA